MVSKKRALLSLHDLQGIEEIAQSLQQMEWEIIATDETVSRLAAAGITVESVSDFLSFRDDFGFPPTLHPRIESALTKDVPYRIDLVYDSTYPVSCGIDVGGLTLLALAAKGKRIPCTSLGDMKLVIEHLKRDSEQRRLPDDLQRQLVQKAFLHISRYYLEVASSDGTCDGMVGTCLYQLFNGENPYQVPANLYALDTKDPLSLASFINLGGAAPCFVNIADLDAIVHAMCIIAEAFRLNGGVIPFIVVAAKHGNACGIGVDNSDPEKAIEKALYGNPRAIWGGEIICNFALNGALAKLLFESERRKELFNNPYWMLDVIAAPDFDDTALQILGKKSSRKLLKNSALRTPMLPKGSYQYRFTRGSFMRQPYPDYIPDFSKLSIPHGQADSAVVSSLIIAWAAAFSSNHGGNEVALANDNGLFAVGGGPSTVDAARVAVERARENGHDLKGSVFAADAFFPFTDAPELLCRAGCSYGIVPSGGKNEETVSEFFRKNNVSVFYLPSRCRGFIRH